MTMNEFCFNKFSHIPVLILLTACGGVSPELSGSLGGAGNQDGSTSTAGNSGVGGGTGPNCNCVLGAYRPACGVDGKIYDSTCGDSCVPVAIACHSACPCSSGGVGGSTGQGGSGASSTGGSESLGTAFACGTGTCNVGATYCYQYYPGVAGATSSGPSCSQLASPCANATDCSCVCSHFTPSGNCNPVNGCSCSSTNGEIHLTCAGQ